MQSEGTTTAQSTPRLLALDIAISGLSPDIKRIRHAARVANIPDYIEALPWA